MTTSLPLQGVRVLDLSNLLAAPMTTMHLADFGADVIKVEHPAKPDELRVWGRAKDDVGLYWKVVNRNKRLITLDLSHEKGRELALELARRSDVVVENFRPGTINRWGLGYDALSRENPGLVMAHISGYGQTGPYSHRSGFGTVADAFSGYAAITGHSDGPPLLASFGLSDAATSIFGAFAIMVALRHRDKTGEGQEIDAALYEALFTLIGPNVIDYDQLGAVQQRNGSRLPFVSPRNTFQTSDGQWIAIAGSTQATFERTARGLGIEHVIHDPRFATNRDRIANVDALEEELQRAISKRTRDEVLAILDESDAPGGPVYDIPQIFNDPHFRARRNMVSIPDEQLGVVQMQNVTPRLSKTPGRIAHTGMRHGEHNSEVYTDLLGLRAEELHDLSGLGVI